MGKNDKPEYGDFLPLEGTTVLVGVCGSVAAYKSADLVSKLVQHGASVKVLMTAAARRMVGEATFGGLCGTPPITDFFDPQLLPENGHIRLAREATAMIVAPATANTIAKLAYGIADDPVTTVALATQAPLLIAPAMETAMYEAPSTKRNIATLTERGARFVGPHEGRLASGAIGTGRLAEPYEIREHLRLMIGANGDFKGKRVVVTAGGTREKVDAVRFLTNLSTGKMGYAVAEAARDRGAEVVLISASEMESLAGVEFVRVTTAAEMLKATTAACADADALIMAAAVADFKPERDTATKLTRANGNVNLKLAPNADIIASINRPNLTKVAFAAQTDGSLDKARDKMRLKGAALTVVNDVLAPHSGFGTDTNQITIITADGKAREMPLLDKLGAAHKILNSLVSHWNG